MVPAAIAGVDVATLLDRAVHAAHVAHDRRSVQKNPAALLGAVIGALALQGRDKLTLITPRAARHARPLDRAAHRREHRQGREGHRAGRRRAAARRRATTATTASSSAVRLRGIGR